MCYNFFPLPRLVVCCSEKIDARRYRRRFFFVNEFGKITDCLKKYSHIINPYLDYGQVEKYYYALRCHSCIKGPVDFLGIILYWGKKLCELKCISLSQSSYLSATWLSIQAQVYWTSQPVFLNEIPKLQIWCILVKNRASFRLVKFNVGKTPIQSNIFFRRYETYLDLKPSGFRDIWYIVW